MTQRKKTTGIDAITEDNMKPIVARRLIAARKLSGLDQLKAADRLGYANSSQLSKMEGEMSGVKVYVLARAAMAYGVSMDYLAGLSDYPERDAATGEQLAIMRSLRTQFWDAAQEKFKALQIAGADSAALLGHIGVLRNAIGDGWKGMCEHEQHFAAALEACPELNSLPEDIGPGLLRVIRRAFATSLQMLKDKMEPAIEQAEDANRYLKRRQALKAHEYLDDVEQNYPLLAAIERGNAGAIETREALPQLELLPA